MANYPDLPQLVGSVRSMSTGTQVDRAVSGKPRFRTFYSQDWGVFKIQHEVYTSDKDLIEAHYRAHKFSEFEFIFAGDGLTYTCRYAEYPEMQPIEGDFRWKVSTYLVIVDRKPYGMVAMTVSSSIAVTGVKA